MRITTYDTEEYESRREREAAQRLEAELDEQAYRLGVLGESLTIAGALCAAFELGLVRGYASCPCDGMRDDYYYKYLSTKWAPGCGKPAPDVRTP